MVSDENREWTNSPKHQNFQTQQEDGLVHTTLMRKTRTRSIFFVTLNAQRRPPAPSSLTTPSKYFLPKHNLEKEA